MTQLENVVVPRCSCRFGFSKGCRLRRIRSGGVRRVFETPVSEYLTNDF